MKLESRRLRYFVAVAEELHFGRAAERLSMSQPPLSQQIRQLEAELGVRLFERTQRSVKLTPPGRVLFAQALPLLSRLEGLVESVQAAARGDAGLIRLGYTAASASHLIPLVVRAFRRKYPLVEVVLHERVSSEQIEELSEYRLDVGMLRPLSTPAHLAAERLIVDHLVLALPSGHRLSACAAVDVKQLDSIDFIGFAPEGAPYFNAMIGSLLQDARVQPRLVHRATQSHTVLALVGAGLGVAVVSATATLINIEGVIYRPLLADRLPRPQIDLCWRRDALTPLLENFIACAQEAAVGYVPRVSLH